MSELEKTPTSNQDGVIGISWDYTCGVSGQHDFERVYKAEIKGVTVWKNATRHTTIYTIGEKKLRYNSEQEILEAIENGKR